jgi:tetratricopeptide (TPR) repeat protein
MTSTLKDVQHWVFLGVPCIKNSGGTLPSTHPSAMLAFLAVQPTEGWVERKRIAEELTDVSDPLAVVRTYRARANKLLVSYGLCLEENASRLRIPQPLTTDVQQFLEAFGNHDYLKAFSLYTGSFLQGFDLENQWPTLRELRERLHQTWFLSAERAIEVLVSQNHTYLIEELLEGILRLAHFDDFLEPEIARRWCGQAQLLGHKDLADALLKRFLPDEKLGDLPVAMAQPSQRLQPLANLPTPNGKFIGRTAQLERLTLLLQETEVRLISVVGLGGSGKTRLAIRAAADLLERFSYGTFFVSLREVRNPLEFYRELAHTLALPLLEGIAPEKQVLNFLCERELLLILDNCESMKKEFPDFTQHLEKLLSRAPRLKVLTTSRERLTSRNEPLFARERVLRLESMETEEAEILFLRLAGGEATHSPELRAKLLPQLGGLPLAIELVARRVAQGNQVGLEHFLEQPGSPEALFDRILSASLHLLEPQAQDHLLGLGLFKGGLTATAAAAILGTTLSDLTVLERASLLGTSQGGERYDLHPLIAQGLKRERGDNNPKWQTLQNSHAHYYLNYFAARPLSNLSERDLHDDLTNLKTAWDWALQHNWFSQDHLEQGFIALTLNEMQTAKAIFTQALLSSTDSTTRNAEAHYGLATALKMNDPQQALDHLKTALDLSNTPNLTAKIHLRLGLILLERDPILAKSHLEESRTLSEKYQERNTLALSLRALGRVSALGGNLEQAKSLLEKSIDIFEQDMDFAEAAKGYTNLGIVQRKQGNYEAAQKSWESSELLYMQLDSFIYLHPKSLNIGNLAVFNAQQKDYINAVRQYSQMIDILEKVGDLERAATVYLNRADCFRHVKNTNKAIADYKKGLSLARKIEMTGTQIDLISGCALLFEQIGLLELSSELVGLVQCHPLSSRGAKDEVQALEAAAGIYENDLEHLTQRTLQELASIAARFSD